MHELIYLACYSLAVSITLASADPVAVVPDVVLPHLERRQTVVADQPVNLTINENHVHDGVIPAEKLIIVFGIAFGVFVLGVIQISLQWFFVGRPAERKKKMAEREEYGFERLDDELQFQQPKLYLGRVEG